MRLAGRIVAVLAVAAAPTVVVLIGCNVDNISQLQPLQDELPNKGGSTPPVGTVSSTTTATTTTSTSSSLGGTAQSVCDCASAIFAGSTACQSCEMQNCDTQYTLCVATGDCASATTCVKGCGNQGVCIAGCHDGYPTYGTLLDCLFNMCAAECGVTPPLTPCPISDAGADG